MMYELERIHRRVRWLRGWGMFIRVIAVLWLAVSTLVIVVGMITIDNISAGTTPSGTSFTQAEIEAIAEATTAASFLIAGASALGIFSSLMVTAEVFISVADHHYAQVGMIRMQMKSGSKTPAANYDMSIPSPPVKQEKYVYDDGYFDPQ